MDWITAVSFPGCRSAVRGLRGVENKNSSLDSSINSGIMTA